jgi:hypothetical protein
MFMIPVRERWHLDGLDAAAFRLVLVAGLFVLLLA